MGSILNPFSNILSPGRFQVPIGRPSIDWSNPLTNGLVNCYLPGVSDVDIVGRFTSASQSSPGSVRQGITQEGAGFDCTVNDANNIGQGTTSQSISGAQSIYWRGYVSNFVANGIFGGTTFSQPNVSPFMNAWLQFLSASALWHLEWNTGSGAASVNSGAVLTVPAFYSLAGTILNGGSAIIYQNGVVNNTLGGVTYAGGTGAPVWGTNNGSITNLMCIWNRQLSDAEIAWLDSDPYGFLVPAEYEMPAAFLAPQVFTLMPQIVT